VHTLRWLQLPLHGQLSEEQLRAIATLSRRCRQAPTLELTIEAGHETAALDLASHLAAECRYQRLRLALLAPAPSAFRQGAELATLEKAHEQLAAQDRPCIWQLDVQPGQAHRPTGLVRWLGKRGIDFLFCFREPAAYAGDETEYLEDYCRARPTIASEPAARRLYYDHFLARLEAAPGPRPQATLSAAELTPEGLEQRTLARLADESGAAGWSGLLANEAWAWTSAGRRHRVDASPLAVVATVARQGCGALLREGVARLMPRRAAAPGSARHDAVLIGTYGGEHVGDAAILGGVLLRLARERGIRSVALASFRPGHTRRLVAQLDTPVAVEVFDYTLGPARDRIRRAGALVLAGGPLMDLPSLLVRHLDCAATARRAGVPFAIEGIGIGPFRLEASRRVARRIARLADSLSVRSGRAADSPLLDGLEVRVRREPAFDYLEELLLLESHGEVHCELPRALADLLCDAETVVGLNLRPTRPEWDPLGREHGLAVERDFLDRLADALGASARAPYLFFPMNCTQLGSSDLESAWQLRQRLPAEIDLRVWEAELTVRQLVALLRHLDRIVAMRLHANVFGLALGRPMSAIDYYPGTGGKVGELYADIGHPECATRIDLFEPSWLGQRLSASSPEPLAAPAAD
jgi:polysaccharide pyruvyl transferase WcaK-like protein